MRSPLIARAVSRAPNAGKAARRKPAAPLASFPIGRNLGMTAQIPLRSRRAESTDSTNLLHRGYNPRTRGTTFVGLIRRADRLGGGGHRPGLERDAGGQ